MIKSAELGNDEAMLRIGNEYRNGTNGFEKDVLKSISWFLESGRNNPRGMIEVIKYLMTGTSCGTIRRNIAGSKAYLAQLEKRPMSDGQTINEIEQLKRQLNHS